MSNQERELDVVEAIASFRKQVVTIIGGTFVDGIGLLAALIPFILVTSLLHTVIFKEIIPDPWFRFVASIAGALVIEGFAIASMILDYQVKAYNATLKDGEPFIRYNGDRAKWIYIILVLAIVTLGHVIPAFAPVPDGFVYLTLIPMVLLAWFGYEMFAVGFTLHDHLEARKQRELNEQLAEATQKMGERQVLEAQTDQIRAQTELARENRLAAEAQARKEESSWRKAESYTKREELKQQRRQAQPVVSSRRTASAKSWRDYSLAEIQTAVEGGADPLISIANKPVEQRYKTWLDIFGDTPFSKTQALEHADISNSTFLNDVKALLWNGLIVVEGEAQGIYRFVVDDSPVISPNGSSQG